MSELLTVRDVATVLKCGEDAVVRRFAKLPGVIDLGKPETRSRRRYRVLRIPKVVVEQYLTGKSGRSVRIDVPERPERRRRSENWENRAILNLAKAAKQNVLQNELQNKLKAREMFARIADYARVLAAHVPESLWTQINWLDDEE